MPFVVCQFGGYGFLRLLFGVVPAGGMFQQKIDKIFKDLPDVFGIVDDILIVKYGADDRNHDRAVTLVCYQKH